MAIKDVELYNKKNLTKVNVDYDKEYYTFLARVELHNDKVYQLMLIDPETKKERYDINGAQPIRFNIVDEDIERVDILPDSNDIYKFYLVSDATHGRQHWVDKFRSMWQDAAIDTCLKTERLDYDLQFLSDEMFSYIEVIMKQYEKEAKGEKVYIPLAHIISMEIFSKLFGEASAAFLGSNPFVNVFVLMWLHGYLLSSAIKKQGVKLRLNEQTVTKEEIEEKEKALRETLDRILQHFHEKSEGGWKPEEEDEEDDRPTDQA